LKQRLTKDQRQRALEMLESGADRDSIAAALGISVSQVSAIAAHRTMGTYARGGDTSERTLPIEQIASDPLSSARAPRESSGVSRTLIPLGTDLDNGQPINWDPHKSANPHVLIVGESGYGKTYTASCLISELAHSSVPSIVFDYGQGFSLRDAPSEFREWARPIEFHLSRDGIGINPLQIFPVDLHGPATVAQRIADTFGRVYPRIGIQQHAVLRRAVLDLLADHGISADDPRTWKQSPPPFRGLEKKLSDYASGNNISTRRAASSAGTHVSTLFFFDTFRHTSQVLSWPDLIGSRGQVWILQLGGLESSVERAVTEFLLWSLIRHLEVIGPGPLRCFAVLDEAHKLSFGAGSPVEKILREGRKFGLGVILASQQSADFSQVAFANTATKIVFQVDDQSGSVARHLHRKAGNSQSYDYISSMISKLPRGCAYVVTNNNGRTVRMFSFEERDNLHSYGHSPLSE
jgi:DNA phosphorothioation-dependent restriction protein DptH